MKQGDLVVVRFDDALSLGMILGMNARIHISKSEHAFVYVSGKEIRTSVLPRSRFIQVKCLETFSNIRDVDFSSIISAKTIDASKLSKWIKLTTTEAVSS